MSARSGSGVFGTLELLDMRPADALADDRQQPRHIELNVAGALCGDEAAVPQRYLASNTRSISALLTHSFSVFAEQPIFEGTDTIAAQRFSFCPGVGASDKPGAVHRAVAMETRSSSRSPFGQTSQLNPVAASDTSHSFFMTALS